MRRLTPHEIETLLQEPHRSTYMQTSQAQPHSETADIERSLLGALLVRPTHFEDVIKSLPEPSVFTLPEHRAIYRAMLGVWPEAQSRDVVSVCERLRSNETLDLLPDGSAYLLHLAESVSSVTRASVMALVLTLKLRADSRAAQPSVTPAGCCPTCDLHRPAPRLEVTDAGIMEVEPSYQLDPFCNQMTLVQKVALDILKILIGSGRSRDPIQEVALDALNAAQALFAKPTPPSTPEVPS